MKSKATAILSGVMGDGYLYRYNAIYRAVRRNTLSLGYQFTQNDFCSYGKAPFRALPDFLNQKKIVYFVRPARKKNFLLHEAAHCVAHEYLLTGKKLRPKRRYSRQEVFCILASEAFANTAELLSGIHASSRSHLLYLRQNCYWAPKASRRALLQRAVKYFGMETTTRLCFFGFLSNLFFEESFSSLRLKEVCRLAKVSESDSDGRRQLVGDILALAKLNCKFRIQTANSYFSMLGDERHVFKLTAFDPLKKAAERHNRTQIERLISTLSV